jgi:flavin reductase (DIM6/NTAB) family NADH-FMN oxidoreductase RutF
VDTETYREIMRTFPTGITIVTAVDENGTPRGLTTNAVTSASLEPPLLLVSVDLKSRTLPAIRSSGAFVVNFMAAEAEDLCRLFASKADDKFSRVSYETSARNLPVLHLHTLAWAECSIERELEVGDHVVFVGLVEDGAATTDRSPLAYFGRSYDRLAGAKIDGVPGPALRVPSREPSRVNADVDWRDTLVGAAIWCSSQFP